MSVARKCNRCDYCFDPLMMSGAMIQFSNPVVQEANDVLNNKVGTLLIPGKPELKIDLCPRCSVAFFIFMNQEPDGDYDGDKPRLIKEDKSDG